MSVSRQELGVRLRTSRKVLGLAQRDFAESIGLSAMQLANSESGRRIVAPETLQKFGDGLRPGFGLQFAALATEGDLRSLAEAVKPGCWSRFNNLYRQEISRLGATKSPGPASSSPHPLRDSSTAVMDLLVKRVPGCLVPEGPVSLGGGRPFRWDLIDPTSKRVFELKNFPTSTARGNLQSESILAGIIGLGHIASLSGYRLVTVVFQPIDGELYQFLNDLGIAVVWIDPNDTDRFLGDSEVCSDLNNYA